MEDVIMQRLGIVSIGTAMFGLVLGCGDGGTSVVTLDAGVDDAGLPSLGGRAGGAAGRGGFAGTAGAAGTEPGGTTSQGGDHGGHTPGGQGGASGASGASAQSGGSPLGGSGGHGGAAGRAGAPPQGGTSGQGGAAGALATGGVSGSGGASDVCQHAADCSAGMVCGEPRSDGQVHCVPRQTSGASLGAPCTTGLATTECAERICPIGVSSRCTRSCLDDSDCADAAGFVCTGLGNYRLCLQGCSTNADCTGSEVCGIAVRPALDSWGFTCQDPRGTVAAGSACPADTSDACASGLCLHTTTGLSLCTIPCSVATDCPATMPICGAVTMSTPVAGAAQQIQACTP